ncbi:MAG: hypothetical protein NTW19_10435 [Planctomycetota bacterium]|nr:hypothetical protein [Planctomycetota bacterium]
MILKILVAVVSLLAVLALVYWEFHRATSPGPLHPTHASVPELRGNGGCVACHGDEKHDLAGACLVCHKPVAAQMAAGRGIHGKSPPTVIKACGACHVEHAGGAVALIDARSFKKSGIADPEKYDHAYVPGFALGGKHLDLHCIRCHTAAHTEPIVRGMSRYLGLSQTCTACHKDVHKGDYGKDCASCHGQSEKFDRVAKFAHTKAFPLTGAHANQACKECHAPGSANAVGNLLRLAAATAPATRPASAAAVRVRTCVDCHASPHKTGFVEAAVRIAGQAFADQCLACHVPERGGFLGAGVTMTVAMHAATSFKLDPPHQKVGCQECHPTFGRRKTLPAGADLAKRFAALFPSKSAQSCEACHADPHKGQFNSGPSQGRCLACHAPTRFKPSAFGVEEHKKSRFPLTGSHEAVSCDRCHAKPLDGPRRFVPTAAACAECHKDVHGGAFDGPDKPALVRGLTGCARCHDTGSFAQVKWTGEDHHLWTGYRLEGKHAQAACAACHKPAPKGAPLPAAPPANGRKGAVDPVLVLAGFGPTPTRCDACHADVHEGHFDRPGRPRVVRGQEGCARCHDTQAFKSVKWAVEDHATWTQYALQGLHAKVSCAACHTPGASNKVHLPLPPPPAKGAAAPFALAASRCDSCHADIHEGQFLRNGVNDCARCHRVESPFKETTFTHARDSAFKLDKTHEAVSCSGCHRLVEIRPGVRARRYLPLGNQCQDCHALPGASRKAPR